MLLIDGGEPENYQKAILCGFDGQKWLEAMQEEMSSLHENQTYDLVKLLNDKKALKSKWIFKKKAQEKTSQPRYKARLVVKEFG